MLALLIRFRIMISQFFTEKKKCKLIHSSSSYYYSVVIIHPSIHISNGYGYGMSTLRDTKPIKKN